MPVLSENNKRIAQNTMLLYARMLLTMLASLYISRIVLNVLGVEDFGIFGVVGGVVTLFSFLNSAMAGSTSRFLTFEIGRDDDEKLKKTFSSALTVHLLIAGLILVLGETVGWWFLKNKLVIPDGRMYAAIWVYQFSLVSMAISVTQIPYHALILAHEKMSVYAYIEMLNVFLKLGMVYLLLVVHADKLIVYAGLVLVISIIITLIYRLYCYKHYTRCRYRYGWERDVVYPMLSFSGWDLYGNMSTIVRTQGVNILLNLFFGPVMNAANMIAVQVQGAVMSFANNIVTATRPQIVKSYAKGDYQYTCDLVQNTSKFTCLLLLFLSLPLMVEAKYVLTLWLKNVPEHAVTFCIYVLIFNFFATISTVVVGAVHATGNIKRPSLINGSLYVMVLPVSYVAFRFNAQPEIPYICNALFVFAGMLSNVYTLKLYVPQFRANDFIVNVLCSVLCISLIAGVFSLAVRHFMQEGLLRLLSVVFISTLSISISGYFLAMDKYARSLVKRKVCAFLRQGN
ncbi:MAG: oligosaccharide flippase family protein [Tannerella sp.]|jgi:O-antigen/teichoic acid export membrane protein|nr:oligosaccharide flippase family protein [Tannerella sp.]